jgi:guanylate kinase
MPKGRLISVTGPSGVGKRTIINGVLGTPGIDCGLAISATTREPRPGEADGKDYHFLSRFDFERNIEAGRFLEYAEYAGNYYGTLSSELAPLEQGKSMLLELEVQGAAQVREKMPDALSIFIVPPDPMIETLRQRLLKRETETPERIEKRLAIAERELAQRHLFGKIIENKHRGVAIADAIAYITQNT